MQLEGVDLEVASDLHREALAFLWELNKAAEVAKLEATVFASLGCKDSALRALDAFRDYTLPSRVLESEARDRRDKWVYSIFAASLLGRPV